MTIRKDKWYLWKDEYIFKKVVQQDKWKFSQNLYQTYPLKLVKNKQWSVSHLILAIARAMPVKNDWEMYKIMQCSTWKNRHQECWQKIF